MSLETRLGRVRGLGSAKSGTEHFWAQRLTALALVPLTLWFVAAVVGMAGAEYATVGAWLHSPVNAVLMLLLIAATYHHMQLGLQVIIEDYIHADAAKFAALLLMKGLTVLLAVASAFAVLKVAFGG